MCLGLTACHETPSKLKEQYQDKTINYGYVRNWDGSTMHIRVVEVFSNGNSLVLLCDNYFQTEARLWSTDQISITKTKCREDENLPEPYTCEKLLEIGNAGDPMTDEELKTLAKCKFK